MEIIDLFKVDALDINRLSVEGNNWYEVNLADGSKAEYPAWFRPNQAHDGSWYIIDEDKLILSRMPVGGTFFDQMYFPYENGYPENLDNFGLEKKCGTVGDIVDIIRFGDDLGITSGPFMDLDTFRKLFKPRYRILCDYVKK